jgi:hypothetical protein
MRTTRGGMWTAVAIIALAGLASGCGAVSQAEQNLKGSLAHYHTAVDNVRSFDLKTATKSEITAARAELAAAFRELEAQSNEAGRDTADLLRSANGRMDKALGDAAALPASGRGAAQATLRGAADSLSSAVDSIWEDVKSVFH